MLNTKKSERRNLQFANYSEAIKEAERLAAADNVTTTGNHSFGQILDHLARTLDIVTGVGGVVKVALPMRILARLGRTFILTRPMKPGFKLTAGSQSVLWSQADVPVEAAISHLREASERFESAVELPTHPIFGNLSRPQHDQLQCRHFELHLSFVLEST